MKRIAWFMAIACMMFILPGCANETAMNEHEEGVQENSSAYHKIDAKEAKSMMDKEKVTIVDVRTEQEYKKSIFLILFSYQMKRLMRKQRISCRIRMLFYWFTAVQVFAASRQATSWYRWDISTYSISAVSMTGRMIR